jgi:hypothetical protein
MPTIKQNIKDLRSYLSLANSENRPKITNLIDLYEKEKFHNTELWKIW